MQNVIKDEVQAVAAAHWGSGGGGAEGGGVADAGLAAKVAAVERQLASMRDMKGRELSGVFGGLGACDDEEQAKGWLQERVGEGVRGRVVDVFV